jgi:hypothetical protein
MGIAKIIGMPILLSAGAIALGVFLPVAFRNK